MDPLSIIGSALTVIELVKVTCQGISKIAGLPKAFDQVKDQLPFVQETLKVAKANAESGSKPISDLPYSEYQPISKLVEQIDNNVKELDRVFRDLQERCEKEQDAKNWEKIRGLYSQVLKGVKSRRVESLMADILKDMEKLTRYKIFQLSAKVEQIQKAISELSAVEPSLPDSDFDSQGSNHATQNIAEGATGTQNNTVGGTHTFISGGNVMTGQGAQMTIVQSPESQAWIRELRVTDPRDDKSRIEYTKGDLVRESYCWILSNPLFREWRNDTAPGPLWIKGAPGKGKTMLLCGIIDELERELPSATRPAYFFCQGTNENLNNATAVLRGLLYMLVTQHPHLHSHLEEKYKSSGQRLYQDGNAWFAMSKIFGDMLSKLPGKVLIVDALDECVTGRPLLLDLIVANSRASDTKWIVSSRDWADIKEKLGGTLDKATMLLELNEKLVSEAVRVYILRKVEALSRIKRYDSKTQDAIYQHLVDKSDDTFLWVALVCKELENTLPENVFKALETRLSGLDSLYQQSRRYIERSEYHNECRAILAVASTVYRPLSLTELVYMAGLAENFRNRTGDLETLVTVCRSFLTIQKGVLHFEHHSAKDFLMKDGLGWILPHGAAHQHHTIFSRSLNLLDHTLRRDIYDLGDPGFSIDDVQTPVPDPLAPARYSCAHWTDHLRDGLPDGPNEHAEEFIEDCDRLHKFLRRNYVHWLEAMSLLRNTSQAVLAVETLVSILARDTSEPMGWAARFRQKFRRNKEESLTALVRDARRFLLFCKEIIAVAPLQLYVSALLFSPQRSIMRNLLLEHESLDWLAVLPTTQQDWDECVQVLEGDGSGFRGVAFSPDGKIIASASESGAVQFWNALSGALEQTTAGHKAPATSVAFSPDGLTAASSSDDGTVKLWNVASGRCSQTLRGHRGSVKFVTFSNNGSFLASTSIDGTIRLWDATSGLQQKRMKTALYHDKKHSLVLSADDTTLFAPENQGLVEVWGIDSGSHGWIIAQPNCRVNCLASSPDGTTIAIGSDATISLWDTKTHSIRRELKGHERTVDAISFSPDGRTVASMAYDHTLRLWDAKSGKQLGILNVPGGETEAMSFSPDGTKIVSASLQTPSLRIWEPTGAAFGQAGQRHSLSIKALVFSPDEETVLSSSSNELRDKGEMFFWDVASGTFNAEVSKSWACRNYTFLPDSSSLVGVKYNSLHVWDPRSGASKRRLKGSGDSWHDIVFSSDGQLMALSVFLGQEIQVWNLPSAKCIYSKQWPRGSGGPGAECTPTAFSPSGRILASVSFNGSMVHKDWKNEKEIWKMEGRGSKVEVVAFWDDVTFAWAWEDDVIHLWNGKTLHAPGDRVRSIVFSPSGSTIAAISGWRDYNIHVWDVASCTKIWAHRGDQEVKSLRFSQDGEKIILTLSQEEEKFASFSPKASPEENYEGPWTHALAAWAEASRKEVAHPALATTQYLSRGVDHDGYHISREGWLMRDFRKIVWFPPTYRPVRYVVQGSTMAIACASGRVLILRFR